MLTHVSGIAMLVADTVSHAPVIVQVAQAAPEPSWRWLLQSVIPVAGGTLIAVWSFVQNRESEQKQWERNQRATHEQWVRDQKKAEWKELLQRIAMIEHEIPVKTTGIPDHEGLGGAIMAVLPELRGTLFVHSVLDSSGYIEKWQEFLRYASGRFAQMTATNRAVQTRTLGEPVTPDDALRWFEIASNEEVEIRQKFHALVAELRTLAQADLAV